MGKKKPVYKESDLTEKLTQLEKFSQKILDSSGYVSSSKKTLILKELIKEQLKNENSRNSNS